MDFLANVVGNFAFESLKAIGNLFKREKKRIDGEEQISKDGIETVAKCVVTLAVIAAAVVLVVMLDFGKLIAVLGFGFFTFILNMLAKM